MKEIAVITATRAEYGLLCPLIRRISEDESLNLNLLVTGTHLSEKYGFTKNEIEKDGFPIRACIPILESGNSRTDISRTVANAIVRFAEFFQNNETDLAVILGDRTEILGVAVAAMNAGVPLAHI